MIAYLPTIYPDELVYSWFCRYYVHTGCFSHKMALQELYCKKSDYLSKEFIGNLNKEAMEQIDKIYSLDKLVLDHTMFPQYARFIPLAEKKEALYRLAHDSCDAHHLFPVLPRNDGEQYLRYCPLCVKEDRKTYGEVYWHRKHQIRNMRICTKHKCRLMESSVPAKSEQSFTFCPAESYTYDGEAVFENDSLAIQYMEYLVSVFESVMDFESDIPISSILYDGMSRTKYLKPSGRSRYTKMLAEDINKFYENMGVCSIVSVYQIQKILLRSLSEFFAICQIAFFLGMKPEELTAPSLTAEQIKQEQDSHYMRNTAPVDWDLLDRETAPVLEKFAKAVYDGTANENGRPERVSEKLVYREMNLLGHQLENMPRCKAIFEKYTESYPETWARKIIWAYRKLEEEGKPFYWTDIRKISGVKKKNLLEIVPYLKEHADADMDERIKELIEF
ncbi:MAG: TniQ family protein [Lachnospiraceae bacterium]|nr:TniQ family protein [Lachnospiraceae bacterium]